MTSRKPEYGRSLADLFPEIAAQAVGWNPNEIKAGSHRKVRWRCELGHEWDAIVKGRTNGKGCPICSGKYAQEGFNDLATTHPEIASQAVGWNPKEVSAGSHRKVRWLCELGHEWDALVKSRVNGHGCSICSGKYVQIDFNDLATTHPEIASQAVGWNPKEVSSGSDRKLRWRCESNHEWNAPVSSRTQGYGCPICSKTGFDPVKPAWVYFLEHDEWEMFQIGITNAPDDRLTRHRGNGWTVLEIRGAMIGESARSLEVAILSALSRRGAVFANQNNGKKFDGFTESWLKSSVKVSGLKDLIDFVHEDEQIKN